MLSQLPAVNHRVDSLPKSKWPFAQKLHCLLCTHSPIDYPFVEEPSQDFYCPVTFGLLLQPHRTSCCRQNLSVEAVNRLQREKKTCPLCREPKWSTELNREFECEVQKLCVFCPYVDRGCKWEGQVKTFDRHVCSCNMSYQLEPTGFVHISKKSNCFINV